MKSAAFFVLPAALTLAISGGCNHEKHHDSTPVKNMSDAAAENAVAIAKVQPSKGAATQPSNQNVTGVVKFVQVKDGVRVTGTFTGFSAGKHGFHVHEKGDMSDPHLQSVGPHYNPGHGQHGDARGDVRHAGDLGNVTADDKGNATYDQTIAGLTVAELIGKSVIVHAKEDDAKTDPSGNSGGRVAGGVIESAK